MALSPPTIAYFQVPPQSNTGSLTSAQWAEIRNCARAQLRKRFAASPNLRREEIEDLCQESVIKFYEHYKKTKGPFIAPAAMLTTIVQHVFFDYCRKSKNSPLRFDDDTEVNFTEFWKGDDVIPLSGEQLYLYLESVFRIPGNTISLSPEAARLQAKLIAQEREQPYFCLKTAALRLADRQRAFIYLSAWKNLSPNEIATYMNVHFPRMGGMSWTSDTVSTEVSKSWKGRCQRRYIELYQQCLGINGFEKHPFFIS